MINKKCFEYLIYALIVLVILINGIIVKDNAIAVVSAFFGILYTIYAGKGKVLCYYFGIISSTTYCYLAFSQFLWGNVFLYLLYYIPMQFIGIFKWKKNLKQTKNEIIKIRLKNKERLFLLIICFVLMMIAIYFLNLNNDKSPYLDGIVTVCSIFGMYLTVRRAIEQWFFWGIVNFLSCLMWIILIIQGAKNYSTALMWFIYFVLGIYFYFQWKKELN